MSINENQEVKVEVLELKIDVEGRAKNITQELNEKYFKGQPEVLTQDILEQYNQFMETGQEYYPIEGNRASRKFSNNKDVYESIVDAGAVLAATKINTLRTDDNKKEIDERLGVIAMNKTGWGKLKHLFN